MSNRSSESPLQAYLTRVVHALEPLWRQAIQRRVRVDSREEDAVTTLFTETPICLIGDPGSGKTTILRMTAYALAAHANREAGIPFFVSAATCARSSERDLPSWLLNHSEFQPTDDVVRLALSGDAVSIIFDGLDELHHEDRQQVSTQLRRWFLEYPNHHWVLSTRPVGHPDLPASVRLASLLDLSNTEIEQTLNRIFDSKELVAPLFSAVASNRDLGALASSPLLLGLIAQIYRERAQIPTGRSDLYASWTDIALRHWDKGRGIGRREDFLGLEVTRRGLAELALTLVQEGRVAFEASDWFASLRHIGFLKGTDTTAAETTFLDNVMGSGLIRRTGPTIFAFAHLTLQEYFAALALSELDTNAALLQLESVSWEGVASFYGEGARDPVRTAAFFIAHGRFDDVRRLLDAFPHLGTSEREEIVRQLAARLGVENVSFGPSPASRARPPDKKYLSDLWQTCRSASTPGDRGKAFEEFATSLFGSVFTIVDMRRLTGFGEIDIICEVKADSFWIRWPGDCFVECKNLKDAVPVSVANEFVGKCSTVRVRLAFLLSAGKLTTPARERISRSWSQAELPDMAWVDGDDIEDWLADLTDAENFLKRVVRRASYGQDSH